MTNYLFKPEKVVETDLIIQNYCQSIKPTDKKYRELASSYCNNLAVPPGALGQLEKTYQKIYGIGRGKVNVDKPGVLVYVSDNGICESGVSSNPVSTTYQVGKNMLEGRAIINLLTKQTGSKLEVVDIGCLTDISEQCEFKVGYSTKNFDKEPAMSRLEAGRALIAGINKTEEIIKQGWNIVGTGEMGVGNTTTSAAVITLLLDSELEEVIGLGAGLNEEGVRRKQKILQKALVYHQPFKDGMDVARKVGGYDILAIAGTFIACSKHQVPCVVDGVISMAGLLVALTFSEAVLDYTFVSHVSMEPGYQLAIKKLGLEPLFHFEMRLGEGSGCPFFFQFIQTACYTIQNMSSFKEAGLNIKDYVDVRDKY
ncbi:nicotinate-nucleotide--dimethylbenzimidazole phosphoribosyltransferase [Vagococcus intermedius]|uniref:Nicotinate-nucleotide--dimethylbenzimidazole phosphoribosyltransferase n=1 Tax=Vagococcus intermedius TaxID=2991418 RepID=A0AAF0IA31_9ENTE|nr:nicotinate-nucleotide--dimethylbenzimidazole phosphoribosyltransferase [Vagococcus intermedius]WEG74072.1 nicotinate-nucleotide--dimethylbenzimidazole phosphoribosyltransferase [Vagococcus intermedius]WEG76152.1 nicotinate-nucleotide--dimethylbenzimidazole phosphoribosyltransferase [Vagococcus intermedius]